MESMYTLSVVPAIIPKNPEMLRAALQRVAGVASDVQIDIVDGVFVPHMSWPYNTGAEDGVAVLASLIPASMTYEFDLMVADPLALLARLSDAQPARVVLHLESLAADERRVHEVIDAVRARGARAVLAVQNDTPLETLAPYVPHIDGVQCMGIAHIGVQGEPFDARVLARIKWLRDEYSQLSISVDGSVNKETIRMLKEAGANRFVAGSAIFNAEDPRAAYRALCDMVGA